ncbi:sentrin-specific protease 7 [Copidosoma floridanum]|uniref:sentrin-specific protease 7 n=1 Tax=Copidosoma floridanum TaxID=29053 RepID=UPI0006C9ADC4|nr:sentrin-specific protease 7 [Copidosoma floridanum]XP_014218712.1 sentrin-specific protease 7 [Copidosoma floridanum]
MVHPEHELEEEEEQEEGANKCDCNSSGSIHILQSMRIDEPAEAPICRKPDEDQVKVLVAPDNGYQWLIDFQLPKECHFSWKVEHLLMMLRSRLHEEEIVCTYLVKDDPIYNVRYVINTRKTTNPKIIDDAVISETSSPMKKLRKRRRSSSDSSCSVSTKSSDDIIEVQSSDQCLTLDLRRNAQVILVYPKPPMKYGITVTTEDFKCLNQGQFLNDIIIDFYLKYFALEKLSDQDKERTYIFNTFFYTKLSNPKCTLTNANMSLADIQHAEVKRWTKNINIFEKEFIIIPINLDKHWFSAVICYPALFGMDPNDSKSECSDGSNHYPCIIIFDSLTSFTIGKTRVIQDLKNYLECEYKEKNNGNELFFDNTEIFHADVPQQTNASDCGVYLLQFIEHFFEDFVATNSLCSLKKPLTHWFSTDIIKKKRNDIRKLIIRLAAINTKGTKKSRTR